MKPHETTNTRVLRAKETPMLETNDGIIISSGSDPGALRGPNRSNRLYRGCRQALYTRTTPSTSSLVILCSSLIWRIIHLHTLNRPIQSPGPRHVCATIPSSASFRRELCASRSRPHCKIFHDLPHRHLKTYPTFSVSRSFN